MCHHFPHRISEEEDSDDADEDDSEEESGEDFDSDELDDLDDDDYNDDQRTYTSEETKSRFTSYSLTSSVIRRAEGLTLLDDRFEKVTYFLLDYHVKVYCHFHIIVHVSCHVRGDQKIMFICYVWKLIECTVYTI